MDFLIQKEERGMPFDLDILFLEMVINERRLFDEITEMSLDGIRLCPPGDIKDMVPVGSIQFVETWLKRCHGIDHINPIEIPKFLRTEEFVKRSYHIVPFEQLPKGKEYFVKDVSRLKSLTFTGDPAELFDERYAAAAPRAHLYQVSEIVDILSEHRAYVIGGRIENLCCYNGSPLALPDAGLIAKANALYKERPDYPGSLTIDVMISEQYGTELVEIHPFISVGLYSTLWGNGLVYAFRDGINYVLKHNTPVRES